MKAALVLLKAFAHAQEYLANIEDCMSRHIPVFLIHVLSIFLIILACIFFSHAGVYASVSARSIRTMDEMTGEAERRRRNIAENVKEATVFVACLVDAKTWTYGTGFVVADGSVLTNAHVVASGGKLKGKVFIMGKALPATEATVVAWLEDEATDFALLRFSPASASAKLPLLPFNLHTRRTDRVSAWGFPKIEPRLYNDFEAFLSYERNGALPPLVYTEGYVSSFVHNGAGQSIVHTADVAKGNSGGPLVNAYGQVVGVNTWIAVDANEGAYVSAALASADAVRFLRACGVEPRIEPLPHASTPTQHEVVQDVPKIPLKPRDVVGAISGYLFDSMSNDMLSSDDLTGEAKDSFHGAMHGDTDAQVRLALSYYYGDADAPLNTQKGVYWMEKAAAEGNARALAHLGVIFIADAEFKNVSLGLECLRKAFTAEPEYGLFLAHYMYHGEALGIAPHFKDARAALEASVKAGNPQALALEALMILENDINTDSADKNSADKNIAHAVYARAKDLATRAASEGVALGHTVLARLALHENNMASAVAHARKAADGGDAAGMALLGMFYLDGLDKPVPADVPVDVPRVLESSERAAEAGNTLGATNLARLYALTEGVAPDLPLAWAYSVMGARHNHASAVKLRDTIENLLTPTQRAMGDAYVAAWFAQWGLKQ